VETPTTEETGYVGSFYVFGHGGCFGEVGHCDVPRQRVSPFDRRGEHQLTPRTKIVIITDQLRRLQEQGEGDLSLAVTVVPVVEESPLASAADAAYVLTFDRVRLLTYD
jgi:tyrosinase